MIQTSAEPETPLRPPWQWTLFGAGLLTLLWVVLALFGSVLADRFLAHEIGQWSTQDDLARRLDAASPEALARVATANLVLHVVALGLAALGAGVVSGRWSPGRPVPESMAAGGLVAVLAVLAVSLPGAQAVGWTGAIIPWTCALSAAGAWLGSRKKGSLASP